ncbi:MAG: TolC family protein [Desulfobacteraceae bacterium]|jgi:cobalt-zinc-cadmium efflux system outer membrane protein|nr:TolC family protein [Desulfobacteraceae bacterium]
MNMHCLNHFSRIALFAIFIITAPLFALAAERIWASETLKHLIQEGLENNQSLKSIEAQVEALNELAPADGSLPDPRLGIGVLNMPTDTFDFDQEPMTQKQIFIAQKIPWAGKRALRSEDAQWSAKQKETMLDAQRLMLSKDIANAWYELGFITKSQEINDRMIELVDRILNAAQSRYETGRGLQQNIFQAQVERSKLDTEQISLKTKHRIIENRINSLLNRTTYQPVVYINDIQDPDIKLSLPELESLAQAKNPELKIRKYDIQQSKTRIHLAEKDYWPDFDIMAAYGQRDESRSGQDRADFFSTTVSINLPVWKNSRQDRKLAAAKAMHQASVQSYENLLENISHRLDGLATEIINLQDNYYLYQRTLLPQTNDWARSAIDA